MSEERYSILLVDDDRVDRQAVRRALNKACFSASLTEVENGREAIAQLQGKTHSLVDNHFIGSSNNFDLILLDYRLPDIDGLNLIVQIKDLNIDLPIIVKIKALNIDLPIIVLTGQGDEEIAVEMMKSGAADYLSKSKIDPSYLSKAIGNAIRIHEAEKAVTWANQRLRASNELLTLKNQELERQQQQIKLQNIQLQEAYNLKSEFLATMSHELRTPMNAIMGFSQLLMRQYPDPLSEQQQNLVQRIFNNSKNLLDMINEMLDFSKIESGKLESKPQRFDLNYLIKLTAEELRSLTEQKQLNLITKVELKDRFVVQDSNFMKRILINLLSNAIKFTETGEIKVKAWEIDATTIAISVSDTGIGIAPEDCDKIFQAFRQADQTFTRQHSGTGLGLAITKSLVSMMKGKISVESEIDQGSTFTVEIPRKYDV